MKNWKQWLLALFLIFIVVGFLTPGHGMKTAGKRAYTTTILSNVKMALNASQAEFETFPKGDSAQIIKALCGQNLKHIGFLSLKPTNTNDYGELIDPWGTAIEIRFGETKHFTLRSAGQDKLFDRKSSSEDDIVDAQ